MKKKNRLYARITARLKQSGYSITRQRRLIIGEIINSGSHFDVESLADTIRAGNPQTGRATVYRTVRLLADTGIIKRQMLGETHSHYELTGDDHGHFVCRACSRIVELESSLVNRFLNRAARAYGFSVQRHSVEIFGMCQNCQNP